MFPPCKPEHEIADWANYRHITTETALIMGLTSDDTDIKLNRPQGIEIEKKTVSVHLYSSKWPYGVRSVDMKKQQLIVDYLIGKGYKVYQISLPSQPLINGAIMKRGTYYDACINVLKTEFLVSCDSGMPWVASAYNHPTLALFSSAYNPLVNTTKNWHPINPNAIYLESQLANDIEMIDIYNSIDTIIDSVEAKQNEG